jgi:hypothetical protein
MEFSEKRCSPRIPVSIRATIKSGQAHYEGYITNVSEHGIEYMATFLTLESDSSSCGKTYEAEYLTCALRSLSDKFAPKSMIELSFQVPSGELVTLRCGIGWFAWHAARSEAVMGMRIINPLAAYLQFVGTLEKGGNGPL